MEDDTVVTTDADDTEESTDSLADESEDSDTEPDILGSILYSTKKILGLSYDYTAFDPEIIMAINTAFYTLWNLGVSEHTDQPFKIEDETALWTDFVDDGKIEMVKSYIGLKTRILFDPPTNGTLMNAIQEQINEFEFRMAVGQDEYNSAEEEEDEG